MCETMFSIDRDQIKSTTEPLTWEDVLELRIVEGERG